MAENIDQETTQEEAQAVLKTLCNDGFDGDTEKLAIVLGRDVDEINDMLSGDEQIDEDLLMKARGIAQARDIELD